MRIYIYSGGEHLVAKSGVGQAIRHQREMLRRAGVGTTDRWTSDAGPSISIRCCRIFCRRCCGPG